MKDFAEPDERDLTQQGSFDRVFLHRYLCAWLFEAVFDWSKAVFILQNPCSNNEIHVPFEHGFWPTSLVNAT